MPSSSPLATRLRIGARRSPLAVWQASAVRDALTVAHEGLECELVGMSTIGDRSALAPFSQIGPKGIFAVDLELALLRGEIDVAVHSYKDLPAEPTAGLSISTVLARADVRDCLVGPPLASYVDLPRGAQVGTGSLRRAAELLSARPDLTLVPLRGNVETRVRRGFEPPVRATVLAVAGLARMGLLDKVAAYLPLDLFTPDAGQGALAAQWSAARPDVASLLEPLIDMEVLQAVVAERSFTRALGADCGTPVGAHAHVAREWLTIRGLVAAADGAIVLRETIEGPSRQAEFLGRALADELLRRGARALLPSKGVGHE